MELRVIPGFVIVVHKVIHGFCGKMVETLYTGSIDDIQALDIYLENLMVWINEMKLKYGIR